VAQVAVRFGNAGEPVFLQNLSNPGRVPLAHLVDAEHQLDVNALLAGELCEKRVLGRARATAFRQDTPEFRSLRDASVWKAPEVACRTDDILSTHYPKHAGDSAIAFKGVSGQELQGLFHMPTPFPNWGPVVWPSDEVPTAHSMRMSTAAPVCRLP